MSEGICGELTDEDELCGLPAGWGREADGGPCRHHNDAVSLPRKWDDDLVETIYANLKQVPSFRYACEAAGISHRTGQRWKRRGRELRDELTEAEIQQDENARRLCRFCRTVSARAGDGKLSILGSVIEYAHRAEDPNALLRALQQIDGGDGTLDEAADDHEWFDAESDVVRYSPDDAT
jgi:hypothetical protein